MSKGQNPREDYLVRLEELLPATEVVRVRADVDALIQDHAAGVREADPDLDQEEAERRAVAALGPPELLAEEVSPAALKIPYGVRRKFVRALAVLFAGHLLLSVVLTVAGAAAPAIAGLLGPLPKEPFADVLMAVITIFLIDTGLMLILFVAIGARRSMSSFPHLEMRDSWTRKEAVQGLLLVVLMALIFNMFIDQIFSVKHGTERQPFLAPDLKALLPYVNIVFAFLALRHVLTLAGRGGSVYGVMLDALAALAGSVLLTLAALQGKLVTMPHAELGKEKAEVLDSLIERVFLLVFIVAALLLIARFVRQALRVHRILRT